MMGKQQVFSMVKKVRYSQGIWTCECTENYLDDHSQSIWSVLWSPSGSQFSQGSILRPVIFNIFISDLGNGMECTLRKISDVGGSVNILDSRAAIKRGPRSWRNGMTWTLWSSTKLTAKSCIWDRVTPCHSRGWEPADYKVTLKKRTWVSTLSYSVLVKGCLEYCDKCLPLK